LIQERDLDQFEFNHKAENKIRLLLQIDHYRNGEESHGWGPGGSLYFTLPEENLSARDYAACEFDIQYT
jgi:Domain of unknown function (DUF1963)